MRLSTFKAHRGAAIRMAPCTLVTGGSGRGKSSVLQAYEVLARLGGGAALADVFARFAGGAAGCVPHQARPDTEGRRGFRIGCTVSGPAGDVRLDVAVQAEPELRFVGERLTGAGQTLFSTALRDPGRRRVQATWRTGGASPVTRAPLPDDRLGTALLPLRVAGRTDGEREVLAAAEQVVVALRSVFCCDPVPASMRRAGESATGLELTGDCGNLAAVLGRVRAECATRYTAIVEAVRAGCAGPVEDLVAESAADGGVRAVLDRGPGRGRTPLSALGDGELRYVALTLVLMTGPDVLAMDPVAEVLPARQAMTVVADGFDRCLDPPQTRKLLETADAMARRGHVRLAGVLGDAGAAGSVAGASVVDLGHDG